MKNTLTEHYSLYTDDYLEANLPAVRLNFEEYKKITDPEEVKAITATFRSAGVTYGFEGEKEEALAFACHQTVIWCIHNLKDEEIALMVNYKLFACVMRVFKSIEIEDFNFLRCIDILLNEMYGFKYFEDYINEEVSKSPYKDTVDVEAEACAAACDIIISVLRDKKKIEDAYDYVVENIKKEIFSKLEEKRFANETKELMMDEYNNTYNKSNISE